MSVIVLKPGLLSTLQDAGRPGHAALGVGRAGAMDGPALQLANALVGNVDNEAAIECTLLGPTLKFIEATVIALTGATIEASVDGRPIPMWTRCHLPAGSVLQLGGMSVGCRSYLAVDGGFDVATVLGSRSTDLHARLGYANGRALRAGDALPTGACTSQASMHHNDELTSLPWSIDPHPWFDFAFRPLALLAGKHSALLDERSQQILHNEKFLLSKDSNRTAGRLDGHTLSLRQPLELISEATLPGTLQLPPSGQPIALLAEAPVTGGYPRIGQIAVVDLPRLAQRRPGDAVCFRPSTLDDAVRRLHEREQRLGKLIQTIQRRLRLDRTAH
jgi:antagonist of KipI